MGERRGGRCYLLFSKSEIKKLTPIRYFVIVLLLLALSCKQATVKFIETASYPNLVEGRLGQSSYYVKYPSTMFIEEARGKEGQLGYGLWPIDSISRYTSSSAFIEIEQGRPVGRELDCDISIENVRSNFLGGTIRWSVCKSENEKYYTAIASKGKLRLSVNSKTRFGLDSMIAIVATLTLR